MDRERLNKDLQKKLMLLGFYPTRMSIDGDLGRYSRAGIRALQFRLIELGLTDPIACGYEKTLDFEVTDGIRLVVDRAFDNLPHLPTRTSPPEHIDLAQTFKTAVPMVPYQLLTAILHHESGSGHWHKLDADTWIVTYGCDYTGKDARRPGADCKEPWIKSRGWGLGQVTPPKDRAIPPKDYLDMSGETYEWPVWILSATNNLQASIKILKGLRPNDVGRRCKGKVSEYDCRYCPDAGQWTKCVWWAAALRYAGSGPYAENAVREFHDVLNDIF